MKTTATPPNTIVPKICVRTMSLHAAFVLVRGRWFVLMLILLGSLPQADTQRREWSRSERQLFQAFAAAP
jgi:hypothetical protein